MLSEPLTAFGHDYHESERRHAREEQENYRSGRVCYGRTENGKIVEYLVGWRYSAKGPLVINPDCPKEILELVEMGVR